MCFIIVKARELQAKVAPDDPDSGSNPTDDRGIDILEDFLDDPTYEEFAGAIDELNVEQKVQLLTMAWIGRGDYSAVEWAEAYREARDAMDADLVTYLAGSPLIGDYLEDGYNQLGYSCEDYGLDRL